ncbi:hypothetical protein ACFYVL_43105 [Streptomyces sp. NPDC004111]|uniref:hypothetical protein n=1 Tax=Streptomyces sp. NPDC004111 TaxID=3364690 RepID=UPI00369E9FB8
MSGPSWPLNEDRAVVSLDLAGFGVRQWQTAPVGGTGMVNQAGHNVSAHVECKPSGDC